MGKCCSKKNIDFEKIDEKVDELLNEETNKPKKKKDNK